MRKIYQRTIGRVDKSFLFLEYIWMIIFGYFLLKTEFLGKTTLPGIATFVICAICYPFVALAYKIIFKNLFGNLFISGSPTFLMFYFIAKLFVFGLLFIFSPFIAQIVLIFLYITA